MTELDKEIQELRKNVQKWAARYAIACSLLSATQQVALEKALKEWEAKDGH